MNTTISKLNFSDVEGLHGPQTSSGMVNLFSEPVFEMWRTKITERFGDVEILVDRNNESWFDKIQILNAEFKAVKNRYNDAVIEDNNRFSKRSHSYR